MALSSKAQTIERDFYAARAKANYAAFPELARRYVKHNKEGVVFAQTALLEQAVGEAEQAVRKAQGWSFLPSLDDTPEVIAQPPAIRAESIQEAVENLERVVARGSEELQEYAGIVLARAAIATNATDRLQRVSHYLRNIQLPPAKIPTGYNFALIACGLTVKGMALEDEGKLPEAIVCYDNVSLMVQAAPGEKSEELAVWTEQALYRASLLKLRQGDQLAAIRSFRAYHNQALLWPNSFPLPRRAAVYRYFTQCLSASFKSHTQANGVNGNGSAAVDEQSQFYPASLSLEIAQIHAYWEDALYAVTPFPRANEKSWRVLHMIEQIVNDRKLFGGGNDADKRALVETIYRASQKTFQSPRILRFLFFALVDMGQYDEAVLALKAYLDLVEINQRVKDGASDEILSDEQRLRLDIESEHDVVSVMVAGSRLYSKDLQQPDEALECAKKALETIQKHLHSQDAKPLLSQAFLYQGIAYGLQAAKAHEPDSRPQLYAKSLESLDKAIEILPLSFENHYARAVQLAETREIPAALAAVKQALGLNASHVPSWHLLVLLLSAQKDYDKALELCGVGLRESDWDKPETDGLVASQLEGEEYLALRITQAILHDQVYGAEAALELHEALFHLYTKIFAPEPSSLGESLYDIQSIRQQQQQQFQMDQSEIELGSTLTVPAGGGRRRAGSILSVRSKNGGSEVGLNSNGTGTGMAGSVTNNTLDVPKTNYASSITSSIGSTGSKGRRSGRSNTVGSATATGAGGAGSVGLGRSPLGLLPTVPRETTKAIQRRARAKKVLVTLWLLSAATFRRLGKMQDALKATEEAERTDASNPDVWYQLGLLHTAQGDTETASVSFSKALALAPYHPACLARLGRSYLDAGSLDMAEGVLETTTRGQGWDSAEAWYYLGKVFEGSDRLVRAKECLWYALDLERSRPVRAFTEAVSRIAA
ncbi:hypothetical protein BGZ73_005324 [Actinomortierella ambigua]|nr:hypothetical protein BGZ73_005324 [Actinomortierella ambigua]